ncbi:MAG: peptide chain release factor 2 [Chthonomonadales bacterium]|nr:peptide chain release factor 2 [Chthonomonadales bacterium]
MPIEDVRRTARELRARIGELGEHLDCARRQGAVAELETRAAAPNLWEDPEAAQEVLQKLAHARESIAPFLALERRATDLVELTDLAADDERADGELDAELTADAEALRRDMERFELITLLSGEHDARNAIVEINAGAGGTESCDWAQLLLRMYMRWAQEHNFQVEVADEVPGDVAGVKSVTFEVVGRNAYGYLKGESGVHRLVRISPFDSNKRRHTSFASVDVVPDVEETDEVTINPDDLRVDTYRSSGAGGQHVNKTDSAVRITHIPSGIVVSCQNERSQHKNRATALKVLQARLLERERREEEARMAQLRGEQHAIEWGNQIRSYVFQPYTMIKDHRTGHETGDVIRTMDGAIDPFLQAYLQWPGRRG